MLSGSRMIYSLHCVISYFSCTNCIWRSKPSDDEITLAAQLNLINLNTCKIYRDIFEKELAMKLNLKENFTDEKDERFYKKKTKMIDKCVQTTLDKDETKETTLDTTKETTLDISQGARQKTNSESADFYRHKFSTPSDARSRFSLRTQKNSFESGFGENSECTFSNSSVFTKESFPSQQSDIYLLPHG